MSGDSVASAVVVVRPEEGRAVIGLAVSVLPRVRRAVSEGRVVIVGGTTTRYVAKYLTGSDPGLGSFAVGWVHDGQLGETPAAGRGAGPVLCERGTISRGWPGPLLERFTAGDIYIKGANAVDPQGNAGILMASPVGGTIGAALSILAARGGELIVPVSLQKLIPAVNVVPGLLGQGRVGRVMGSPVGFMPLMAGSFTLVTEVEALGILFGVVATPVAAGGVADCAGAVVLHLSGAEAAVTAAWDKLTALRSELAAESSGI